MLFETAIEMYMTDRAKRLRATTLEGYESAIRKHIAPAWTGREVESITHEELQSWVDSIELPGAADKAFKTFRQIYRWTIRKHQLRIWDVTQGIELPRHRPEKRARMTPEELREMLRAIEGTVVEAVGIAIAALGLRPSEGAGLDWSDIDWRTGWTHIQRGAHTVKGGAVVEYACKTELSDRWLKLPRWALAQLRRLRGNRRSGRLRGSFPRSASTRASSAYSCESACEDLGAGPAAHVGDHRHRGRGGARRRGGRARPHERGDVQAPLPAEHEGGC